MSDLFTGVFWLMSLERAIKSAAQGVILGLGLGEGFNAFDMDWMLALGFAGGAALLSVLTSVASAGISRQSTPDLTRQP